ncbi:MAG: hypothetical protein CVV21_04900 [Candidatus Goldiibacteriota bacterium HGW-Goldbacteria-1]|nr:MAG: hypothetical protein CVV21_04900 [Candidatus Goldiibacteriota bacterium HGW-Goldbacteria-1]
MLHRKKSRAGGFMKKILIFFAAVYFLTGYAFGSVNPEQKKAEIDGDKYFTAGKTSFRADKSIKSINSAIASYDKALGGGKINPAIMVKYVDACDFKHRYFTKKSSDKKKAYEALIKRFESSDKKLLKTAEYNYVMALLWGRRGEITQNVMDNSNKDVAEKIKFYGEELYRIDKNYSGSFACKILGRLHYMSPNIPVFFGWPDKNKSKSYLTEFLKANPADTEGGMFLADTLWEMGDTKGAKELYIKTAAFIPDKENRYYAKASVKAHKKRMKKLNIALK